MSTVNEIYDNLATAKASMQELHDYVVNSTVPGTLQDNFNTLDIDLKSKSKVANWRLFLRLMAYASWLVEVLFSKHMDDIASLLAIKRPHTKRWYAETCKMFQYGYSLVWKNDTYVYDVDDPGSRIVKYSAGSEKNGKVLLKVANEVNGLKVPLTNVQKSALELFWSKYRDAGVKVEIVSQPADTVKITITIVRDRMVLDATNHLIRDASIDPVKVAIDTYGTSLEFDGRIVLSDLFECIKKAEGVVDLKITGASVKPSGGNWSAIDMSTDAASGYFDLSYTESNFTFIENVNVEIIH